MRDRYDPRDRRNFERDRGMPDGLLVGLLAFVLGLTFLVWTATGLAGLFAKGAWPKGVTLTRTPLAIRQLVADPHDMTGAWEKTPAGDLSGYGLFWGLLIGQVMVLVVLTVFVLGTVARWRAVRRRAVSAGPADSPDPAGSPNSARPAFEGKGGLGARPPASGGFGKGRGGEK